MGLSFFGITKNKPRDPLAPAPQRSRGQAGPIEVNGKIVEGGKTISTAVVRGGTDPLIGGAPMGSANAFAANAAGNKQRKRAAAGALLLAGQPEGAGINPAASFRKRMLSGY